MSTTALIASGISLSSKCTSPKTTISLLCSSFGIILSILFGFFARANDDSDATEYSLYANAILFGIILIISWLYRSLEKQLSTFAEENDELRETGNKLEDTEKELSKTQDEIEKIKEELQETRNRLSIERQEFDQENDELRASLKRFDEENKELTTQVANLNKLHNKSVNMIQQLALYGDECKTFGKDLKDTASDLKHTDESLGLTSKEFTKKLVALDKIVDTLEQHVVDNV